VRVWRGVAAGLSAVVAAATGVVTNLVTNQWSLALGVAFGLLVLLGVGFQAGLTMIGSSSVGGGDSETSDKRIRSMTQRATASDSAVVIQAGRDAHVSGSHPRSRGLRRNL
jgi:hypothetical protein